MRTHGGQLHRATQTFSIPLVQWLDLSTGINPHGYPIPPIPAECWLRLPEHDDGLIEAARQYYQCEQLLACAGSQATIELLPQLRPHSVVGVLSPAYTEHAYGWQKAGHQLLTLTVETIDTHLHQLDVLIIINPNNPTGIHFSPAQLLHWHERLQRKNGWLIVDEAFIDVNPANSLTALPPRTGLIILRSLGKFFGLAGLRCGFIITENQLFSLLEEKLGLWSISHPSRYVATAALLDTAWQQQTRCSLPKHSERLRQLLNNYHLPPTGSNTLFQWLTTPHAEKIYHQLAQQGILVRLFNQPPSLRFGLPKDEAQWQRLEHALQRLV